MAGISLPLLYASRSPAAVVGLSSKFLKSWMLSSSSCDRRLMLARRASMKETRSTCRPWRRSRLSISTRPRKIDQRARKTREKVEVLADLCCFLRVQKMFPASQFPSKSRFPKTVSLPKLELSRSIVTSGSGSGLKLQSSLSPINSVYHMAFNPGSLSCAFTKSLEDSETNASRP